MFEHEDFLISKIRFARFIRKIMQKYSNENLRIQFVVLNALQEIVKTFFFFHFSSIYILFFRIILQLLINMQ